MKIEIKYRSKTTPVVVRRAKRYVVVDDRQNDWGGVAFGGGRCFTADEWIQQAREWAEADDNTDIDNYLERMQKNRDDWTDEQVLGFIDEAWSIEFDEIGHVMKLARTEEWAREIIKDVNAQPLKNRT